MEIKRELNITIVEEKILPVRLLRKQKDKHGNPRYASPIELRELKCIILYKVVDNSMSFEREENVTFYTKRKERRLGDTRYTVDQVITTWEKSKTPPHKPLYKFNDEALKKRNFSTEQINDIRGRTWRAKDAKRLANRLKVTYTRAKELLEKHSSYYKAFMEIDPEEIKAHKLQLQKNKGG